MRNYLNIIRDNLSVITLVPIIIGGLLQVVLLGSIGLGYIRFFSISQVLSDGLLILGIIVSLFLGGVIPRLYFDGKLELFVDTNDIVKKKKRQLNAVLLENKGVYFIALILILFSTWLSYELYKSATITIQDNIFKILSIALAISIIIELLATSLGVFLDRRFEFYKRILDTSSTRSIMRILLYTLLFIGVTMKILSVLINTDKTEKLFYGSFSFPMNMKNAQNLKLTGDEKIIYFNDKYIFIKNNKDGGISIVELDELFSK